MAIRSLPHRQAPSGLGQGLVPGAARECPPLRVGRGQAHRLPARTGGHRRGRVGEHAPHLDRRPAHLDGSHRPRVDPEARATNSSSCDAPDPRLPVVTFHGLPPFAEAIDSAPSSSSPRVNGTRASAAANPASLRPDGVTPCIRGSAAGGWDARCRPAVQRRACESRLPCAGNSRRENSPTMPVWYSTPRSMQPSPRPRARSVSCR